MDTVTRIVCGEHGEAHYSATPDLAMDICPLCDTRTQAVEIELTTDRVPVSTVKKTLLDLLYEADAIEIDGVFCRHFHMEYEEVEEDDDTILEVQFDADYQSYDFSFTKEELLAAKKFPESDGWNVNQGFHSVCIVPYKLTELKA